jgi:uncharacterized protein YndB with AHSA1/START domain
MTAEGFSLIAALDEPTIVMTRVFNAPRRLVFDAWTRPEHVKRWWGPPSFMLTVCEIDLRPGGAFRWVNRAPDGTEYPFQGVYDEIVPSERLVFSVRAMASGPDSISTLTFVEKGGKTRLTTTIVSPTVEVRDAMIKAGFEHGSAQTWGRLGEHLGSLV